ncbi:MAG: SUMF1/EgtB/PvdO family nonheme iron enzyme, partial [bacterium]|nr:SUMF1/EgtB/PvdO family nonheme iron enzyme [bacterium]
MGRSEEEAFAAERPEHNVELTGFSIGRYPVTNIQYQAFVVDGGYTEAWRSCWTDAGWEWKGERAGPDEQLVGFLLANQPRVGVS